MKRKVLGKYLITFLIITIIGGFVSQGIIVSHRNAYIEGFENAVEEAIINYEELKNNTERLNNLKKWFYEGSDYAYLLDSNFDFISHPNTGFIGEAWTTVGVSKFSSVQEELIAGKNKITFIYTFDGRESISVIYRTTDHKFIVFNGDINR